MFILTIYFIVLNVYVEFVLIYRPHPVYDSKSIQTEHKKITYTVPFELIIKKRHHPGTYFAFYRGVIK